MKNKFPVAIGIFFLAFLLVVVTAVSAATFLPKDNSDLSVQEQIDHQSTVAAYETQQEAYEDLITQANEQLMSVNATMAASNASSESEPEEAVGLTPEEAVTLAQAVAVYPETLTGSPELVNFEGTVAYEVKYEEGAIYVSYATGEVLLNGTLTLTGEITSQQAEEIAKNYLGLSSIYLSDTVSVNGNELYRIIFTAGHFVYVDHSGQIVYVQMYSGDDDGSTSSSSTGGDHHPAPTPYEDDDDDHEDEHDD